jgi:hypothetical protein
MEPTGKSWEYWFERLLPLWPWELRDFYDKICENNESVFGEIHFQMAVGSCYLNHARFNRFLSQESRETYMDLVHRTKDLINTSWAKYPDKLDAFEKAFNFEIESTSKFGWPNEITNQEINNLMISKVQFFIGITTEDHAHVVLNRFEDVLKKILGEEVHRDVYGDTNRGEVGFLFFETQAKIIQSDDSTLEAYLLGPTDHLSETGASALRTFLLKIYTEEFSDKLIASIYTRALTSQVNQ